MSCRVALLRMQEDGLVRLPPPMRGNGNGKVWRRRTAAGQPGFPITADAKDLTDLDVRAGERYTQGMIREYIDRALHRAAYDKLEDGTFAGEVPGLQGVLSHAETLEDCRRQLAEVIEEWVLVRVSRGLPIPAVDGITVSVTGAD